MSNNYEHERKFLVKDTSVISDSLGIGIVQGYLLWAEGQSVRVRIARSEDEVYCSLTVKRSAARVSRSEIECPITLEVAEALIELCGSRVLSKTRHPVPGPVGTWTIDVFNDLNEGSVIAEVELTDPEAEVVPPAWCGDEVTLDERYYNEYLSHKPFAVWNNDSSKG